MLTSPVGGVATPTQTQTLANAQTLAGAYDGVTQGSLRSPTASPPPVGAGAGAGAGKGIANAQCGFVDERGSNASSTDSLRVRETCRDFLKGACFRDNCRYAHDAAEGAAVPVQTTQPVCRDYQNGRCFRASCRFYHGTSAEQATAQIGTNTVSQMFNNAQAMYGMGHIGAHGAMKNPQLHLMNRTMNLQNGFDSAPVGFDQTQFGQNLTLDQAVFLQAAVANGAYDSNHMLTAAAMASEILRRSGASQAVTANGFDFSWMTAQQQMAAAAAAAAAAASGGDASNNMYNNGNNTIHMQQHYASVVNNGSEMMNENGGYVPQTSMNIPTNAAPSQYSSWPPQTAGFLSAERQQSKSSDISALPDSLVDSDLASSIDLTSFHTEYAGFGSGTWS